MRPVESDVLVLLARKRCVKVVVRRLLFRRDVRVLVRDVLAVDSGVDYDWGDKVVGNCLIHVGPLRATRYCSDLAGIIKLPADDGLTSIDAYGLVAVRDDATHELVCLLLCRQPYVECGQLRGNRLSGMTDESAYQDAVYLLVCFEFQDTQRPINLHLTRREAYETSEICVLCLEVL